MLFEWDEEKRLLNLERHGIDFLDAGGLFDGRPVSTRGSPRDGEDRWMTTGVLEGEYVTVVWTWRDENRRLISARRARDGEERTHRDRHGTGD